MRTVNWSNRCFKWGYLDAKTLRVRRGQEPRVGFGGLKKDGDPKWVPKKTFKKKRR